MGEITTKKTACAKCLCESQPKNLRLKIGQILDLALAPQEFVSFYKCPQKETVGSTIVEVSYLGVLQSFRT